MQPIPRFVMIILKEKIEDLCPQLTLEEIKGVVYAKWAKPLGAQVTTINYTFDTSSISASFRERIQVENVDAVISTLPAPTREKVVGALEVWRLACGERIEFNYVPKLKVNEVGVTFIGCDNLNNASGATYPNFNVSATNEVNFNNIIVCIPSSITTYYQLKTLFHEIGHVLGEDHPDEVASILQQLRDGKQGLGCSVMLYNSRVRSPVNSCTTEEYCENQTYALYPGPMDKQICRALYPPQLHPFSLAQYNNALFLGFLNGSIEKTLSSFFANIELLNLNQEGGEFVSFISSSLLRAYTQNTMLNSVNTLALLEFVARVNNDQNVNLIQLFRSLASIASLFIYLYEMYANEDAIIKATYLSAFLAANVAGSLIGPMIGEKTAILTNAVVKNIGSLFNFGVHVVSNTLPTSFINRFFGRSDTPASDDEKMLAELSVRKV